MQGTKKLISIAVIIVGALLMAYKIIADSEPGAIPLLIIISGAIFYFAPKFKYRMKAGDKGE